MLGFVYLGSVDNVYLDTNKTRSADSGIDYTATAVGLVPQCGKPKYVGTLSAVADLTYAVVDSVCRMSLK
jgi:hypothetical protein